jgi:L-iditol 2-dehydrogenase
MLLTGIRAMEMREVPDPVINNDTDVLVRIGAVGVCGSDIHYYTTGRIGSMVVEYPFTVGHETAGTVVDVGSAVTHLKPGDRIAIDPAMPCGTCDQCRVGRAHTCRNIQFLGCPGQAEGCLSEFVVMPAECCFPLEDHTTFHQGVLSEPLAIGVYAAKLAGDLTGAHIGILGAGPIGACVLLAARNAGAEKCYITDKLDARLDRVQNIGADWTGNPDKDDVVHAITEQEPTRLDCVFECCGQQEAVDQAIGMLKPGGKLMMVGIPEVDHIAFDIHNMRRQEVCFQNVRRQNECTGPTLDLMAAGQLQADALVTHEFAFEDTKAAFDLVANYEDGVMKAMINF